MIFLIHELELDNELEADDSGNEIDEEFELELLVELDDGLFSFLDAFSESITTFANCFDQM